jgi:hypothetical protein
MQREMSVSDAVFYLPDRFVLRELIGVSDTDLFRDIIVYLLSITGRDPLSRARGAVKVAHPGQPEEFPDDGAGQADRESSQNLLASAVKVSVKDDEVACKDSQPNEQPDETFDAPAIGLD